MRRVLFLSGILAALPLALGCDSGLPAESVDSVRNRDLSGIAGPSFTGKDRVQVRPVKRIPRELFGKTNDAESLIYPDATAEHRKLLDPDDPESPLHFFITEHTAEEGIGPLFNQTRCLGCHSNSADIEAAGLTPEQMMPATLNTVSTPVSRAGRHGVTDHSEIDRNNRPPTAAFTLFGDFFLATGVFEPITVLGGPLQHVKVIGEQCIIDIIPPVSVDPNLSGGVDPITGVSSTGVLRAVGERAGPPYIGRGLMEAIYADDILANDDLEDSITRFSSLEPQPDPDICPGDCVSGRHNMNRASDAFIGGDPVIRVSRFGLRAAGPTMFQFVIGGLQGEIGLTSPFFPTEQNNDKNVGKGCDLVPDPEIKAEVALNLRAAIRSFGIPDYAPELLADPPVTQMDKDVQEGAALFGIDLEAFRSRTTEGMAATNPGDPFADHAISKDVKLGCVSCHIPIMWTGDSPAAENLGKDLLSHRWAPIFSDLLIHNVGQVPLLPDKVRPKPLAGGISRNLADFALPGQGLALGNEFRTAPLMGLGKTGAPFMHDARVFLKKDAPGLPQARIEVTYRGTAGGPSMVVNEPMVVTDLHTALRAAIELHDLPAPPGFNPDMKTAYAECQKAENQPLLQSFQYDVCSRNSVNRSEARNVMEKWRLLSLEDQMKVVHFLESL